VQCVTHVVSPGPRNAMLQHPPQRPTPMRTDVQLSNSSTTRKLPAPWCIGSAQFRYAQTAPCLHGCPQHHAPMHTGFELCYYQPDALAPFNGHKTRMHSLPACMDAHRQRLTHRPLLKCDPLWQFVAHFHRVINIRRQRAMYRGCRKELNVGVQVIAALACCAAVPAGDSGLKGNCITEAEALHSFTNLCVGHNGNQERVQGRGHER
jgi:hypothetical protein